MGCASSHTQKDLQSGDSEGAIEAAASALAGSFAKAGCDIEASAPGEDDHGGGAVDNRSEDGHISLRRRVEAHAARHQQLHARKLTDFIQADSVALKSR